jgi:hypothetical protein
MRGREEDTVKCPVCDVDLLMSERQGVEIDYCPSCRGVWLDRGELDKIIERVNADFGASSRTAPQAAAPAPSGGGEARREERHHHEDSHHGDSYHGDSRKKKQKKPSGFLSDIFEGLGG